MKAITIFEVTSERSWTRRPVSLLDIWKEGEEYNGKSRKWHRVVNLGKVHESCEKLERHLSKLGNSLNGTWPAVGYLQLSEKVQGEGLGEEWEERMKGMEKLSWKETEKTQAVYLMRSGKKHVKELKIKPGMAQWNFLLTFLSVRWSIVKLFCLQNWNWVELKTDKIKAFLFFALLSQYCSFP